MISKPTTFQSTLSLTDFAKAIQEAHHAAKTASPSAHPYAHTMDALHRVFSISAADPKARLALSAAYLHKLKDINAPR